MIAPNTLLNDSGHASVRLHGLLGRMLDRIAARSYLARSGPLGLDARLLLERRDCRRRVVRLS